MHKNYPFGTLHMWIYFVLFVFSLNLLPKQTNNVFCILYHKNMKMSFLLYILVINCTKNSWIEKILLCKKLRLAFLNIFQKVKRTRKGHGKFWLFWCYYVFVFSVHIYVCMCVLVFHTWLATFHVKAVFIILKKITWSDITAKNVQILDWVKVKQIKNV